MPDAECSYRTPALNWKGVDERTDAAAHRLHATHYSWSRTALDHNPEQCYQCHVFARIVAESLAAPIDGSGATDSVPHICGEWYGPGLSFCGICGKCGRCGGTGYALIFRLAGKPAGLPNCRRCRSTGWDPERSLTET